MMVGIVEEAERMQGDAFSDNVDLASRLENLTKLYGNTVHLRQSTGKNDVTNRSCDCFHKRSLRVSEDALFGQKNVK